MWPDRVSNPGPLTYESGALPTALSGPAYSVKGLFFKLMKSWYRLVLEVLFTQDSKVENLSLVLLSALNPTCSAIISSAWSLNSFKITYRKTLLK